jgi:hypothetical protein
MADQMVTAEDVTREMRRIVSEETSGLASEGRVTVTERADPDEEGVAIVIVPAAAGAAGIWIDTSGDQVSFAIGNGGFELWPSSRRDWLQTARDVIRDTRDGHYSEQVRRGRIWRVKVKMRFERMNFKPSYASTERGTEEDPLPPEGELRFEPW